jgi:hypothetical protein
MDMTTFQSIWRLKSGVCLRLLVLLLDVTLTVDSSDLGSSEVQ